MGCVKQENRRKNTQTHTVNVYYYYARSLSLFLSLFRHIIFEMWVCQSRTHNYVHTVVYNVQHAFVCRISLLYENRMVKIERVEKSIKINELQNV